MKERIIDADGVRIDNLSVNFFPKASISMFNGEDWIEQELDQKDILYLIEALNFLSIWYGTGLDGGFPGLDPLIYEDDND